MSKENGVAILKKFLPLIGGIFFMAFVFFMFTSSSLSAQSGGIDKLKTDLQNKLQTVQNKIETYKNQVKQKQKEAVSLNREIGILDDKIQQAQLETEQTELSINELDLNIGEKEEEITGYQEQIDQRKTILAECLQAIYEFDQTSLSEMILAEGNFSDFFNQVQSIESVQAKVQSIVNDINSLKGGVEDQKSGLEDQKNEQSRLRMLQEIQKIAFQEQENTKNSLLAQTKGQESLFKKMMDKASSDVAAIKSQLYMLEGVGLSMSLEDALKHAEFASSKTGVRPAFLLAVLKKESSWGTNVGTGFWQSDMAPRDHDAFVAICKELGFNPDQMPVSRKPSYGWGGAMGPAQFLPSVWQSYEPEIASLTGHNPPNPWDIDDAFTASALKLSKNGASAQTYDAEWKAAMMYFAGSSWNNPVYSFYGDSVMDFTDVIQQQVDAIRGK